jgi:hypothetical protein
MTRGAWVCAAAIAAAAAVHGLAAHQLAVGDPIGELLRGHRAVVAAPAVALAGARLFLLFVAPGWAGTLLVRAAVRALYMPPK